MPFSAALICWSLLIIYVSLYSDNIISIYVSSYEEEVNRKNLILRLSVCISVGV